jgi:hypothetical protein
VYLGQLLHRQCRTKIAYRSRISDNARPGYASGRRLLLAGRAAVFQIRQQPKNLAPLQTERLARVSDTQPYCDYSGDEPAVPATAFLDPRVQNRCCRSLSLITLSYH